mmetsp:Transcript_46576/g.154411  ORF Transcript_46576/g.154411 Transcript_46576/m.154411 type:complete len:332 (-) Transcript_46576:70-1065(-)
MLSKQVAAATSDLALSDVGFSMDAKLAPRATASGSAATIAAALPRADSGPFEVTHTSYTVASQDCSDRTVDVYTPAVPAGRSVPLISYAHGLFGGGGVDWSGYLIPLSAVASYGFVVAATRACNVGCKEQRNCKSVRGDPPCFGDYYRQQIGVLEWAQNESRSRGPAHRALSAVNHSLGYGVAGHSMGGQATLFASSYGNASASRIRAAVMQHPYSATQLPAPAVPFLAFTGSADYVAPPRMSEAFYDAAGRQGTAAHRGFVNKQGATHFEPLLWEGGHMDLSRFTAAWFKLHLEGVARQDGVDYEALIYGKGEASLCGGGDDKMIRCEVS